ncbi:MAG: hypothetical protein ACOZCL_00145 [Bacillota bacterium]
MTRLKSFFRYQILAIAKQPLLFKYYKNMYEDIAVIFGEEAADILTNYQTKNFSVILGVVNEAKEAGQLIDMDAFRMMQIFWGALVGAASIYVSQQELLNDSTVVDSIMYVLFDGITKK